MTESMNPQSRKSHWEQVYQTKSFDEVSWYQPKPEDSLWFFQNHKIPHNAKIIDVGGGDSYLVDHLLKLGYSNITVLDISLSAINKAKQRLGTIGESVNWIQEDIASFEAKQMYDFWHDRAAFHFLTETKDIEHYVSNVSKHISKGGHLVLGTFSHKGPLKCSGLPISQYTKEKMLQLFGESFNLLECQLKDHKTPSGNIQNFIFCDFVRT